MRKVKAAKASIASNTSLVVLKLVVGFAMMSVSVISEAIHSMMDLLAAIIANYSVTKSSQPADADHTYGHGKYENLSGVIEALLIFIAAAIIIYEAILKLIHGPEVVLLEVGIVVMGISAGINFLVSRYLYKVAKEEDSIALEADALHLKTDVWTSLGIFIGLIVIRITGFAILDPIIAIVVALIIIKAAWDLTRRSGKGLLDEKLSETDENIIRQTLNRRSSDFLNYHSLRTRKAGSERFVDLHLVVKHDLSIEEVHDLADSLEKEIETALSHTDVTIHIEPCDCVSCFHRNGVTTCRFDMDEETGGECYERTRNR